MLWKLLDTFEKEVIMNASESHARPAYAAGVSETHTSTQTWKKTRIGGFRKKYSEK
jgi:hypothetical protein